MRENEARTKERMEQMSDRVIARVLGVRRMVAERGRERKVCSAWVSVFNTYIDCMQYLKHSLTKFLIYLQRHCLGPLLAIKGILNKTQSEETLKSSSQKSHSMHLISSAKYYSKCHLWQGTSYFLRQHFQSILAIIIIKLLHWIKAFPMALSSY